MINNESKIVSLEEDQATLTRKLTGLAKPVVFTNGCFDILHRGHVTYLEQARNLGASLIVGVNSDGSVKRQGKSDDRPINNLADRMAVLAALSVVDLVVAFDDDTPLTLIEFTRPDVLVKGGDWPVDQIVGAEFVASHGGSVHSIAFKHDRSTTSLVNKIRNSKS